MDWQEILRDTWQTSLVFFSLLLFTRFLGKSQVGQLTFYEYVSGITIGSLAANIAASEPDKVWSHYYDLVILVLLTYLVSVITEASRPLRKMIEGSPTIVIENGYILEENMGRMRYDLDELNAQLRENGVFDPSEVQYGILETTGKLSIIKKSDFQPVTKSDLNIHTASATFPVELIMDGVVIERNLDKLQKNREWLVNELAKQNISDTTDVTYAVIDSQGKLFINPKTSSSNQKNE